MLILNLYFRSNFFQPTLLQQRSRLLKSIKIYENLTTHRYPQLIFYLGEGRKQGRRREEGGRGEGGRGEDGNRRG